ncbi:ROK family protein [Dickeya chrysanthemi Ech1591]|uniref:ROK family protein n=1 Tax=Dickeya chrysanthemi (strain Ech1591) TaxID=561229 RepID=C6CPW5_DICC1|nr:MULTISPECIES: ROK family protein [Dickeya]ACT07766.1 ROK family protein [Dickeya chrysanthemi Ech1591]TYL44435.1 ROK family protein [Dickeya sp. ws52]WJM85893.1 ROK family protein [Dickeya chrysanthemi]
MTTGGQTQIGNIDLVKQLNSAVVYRLIDQQGPISRIQISEQSQLAPASVTKITRQLLERGLIKEVDQQASTGGRRAISIISETRPFHTVAVRLGRHDATLALYDLQGKRLEEEHCNLPENTQDSLENALFSVIEQFIARHQRRIRELIAISVVLPGLVDPTAGVVRYMPHISVDNWPLVENLERRFNIHSFVGHDIRSLALAEHYFGATRDCQDSLLVRVHRGVGAGILVNGKIFLGSNSNVGEIGHIQIDPLGDRCHCGNFGCLETVVSNGALEQRARHLLQQGFPSKLTPDACQIDAICKAAGKGDLLARELIEAAGLQLGKAISIAVNLFNPQRVVIAGEITAADKLLLPAIQRCINTQVLKDFRQNLPVVVSGLQHLSAIGAFALVKRAMLNGVLLQRLLENQ